MPSPELTTYVTESSPPLGPDGRPDAGADEYRGFEDELSSFVLQRALWGDHTRNRAFREAISRTVRKGDTVIDLGAGTGLLGLFACQAGARRVIAIERGPLRALAQALYDENGFGDRLHWIHRESLEVELLVEADVLIGEILGNCAIEEGLLTYFPDARERFLRHGGRLVPERVRVFAAPVSSPCPPLAAGADSGQAHSSTEAALRDSSWIVHIPPAELLGPPCLLAELDLSVVRAGTELRTGTTLVVEREGVVEGVAAWFDADLGGGVRLGSSPTDPATHWGQVLFPTAGPQPSGPGTELEFHLRSLTLDVGLVWTWSIAARGEVPTLQRSLPSPPRAAPHDPILTLSAKGGIEQELTTLLAQGVPFADLVARLQQLDRLRYADTASAKRRVLETLHRTLR